jgi:hypothetical protein
MKVEGPPLYPECRVIPNMTQDALHNTRELEYCIEKATDVGGYVLVPSGVWPLKRPLI